MATVFMRWLETTPEDYERGMRLLTLGRLDRVRDRIVADIARDGRPQRVLVVGSGTGRLAAGIATAGHSVHALDTDPMMVAATSSRLAAEGLEERTTVEQLDPRRLPAAARGTYDTVVAVLVLSEVGLADRPGVLAACRDALRPGGRLLLADEVAPLGLGRRLAFHAVRAPLAAATWLLTRTSTSPVSAVGTELAGAGFEVRRLEAHLGGSLVLFEARHQPSTAERDVPPTMPEARRLEHSPSIRTLLHDAWALFFRVLPPYPSVAPGLYALGAPRRTSPVLVTGNYELTVRRIAKLLSGRVEAWVLVVESGGVNVWCAAGSGRLDAGRVLVAAEAARLTEVVDHRTLVLPQVAAVGIDGQVLRSAGWAAKWGPIRATDIPEYLDRGETKTDDMRLVRFPLPDRLEMASATLGLYALMILVPVWVLWRESFWSVAIALVGLSYAYAVLLPVLPGRDGLAKSVPLAVMALASMLLFSALSGDTSPQTLFGRSVGTVALSVFVAAELQGMSPQMRGEQANWLIEGVVFAMLLAIYLAVPQIAGWR